MVTRLTRRLKERVKTRLRRALGTPSVGDEPLAHVVVAAGTLDDWRGFDQGQWNRRLSDLINAVEPEGVRWLTLVPVSNASTEGIGGVSDSNSSTLLATIDKALRAQRSRVQLIVRPEVDGRDRFARVVRQLHETDQLRGVHATTSEEMLAKALLDPADVEADLVVVIGPPDTLPTSLVWELAYSEIVFLDIPWTEVSAEHIQMAVDDFRRRNRRFGGIDA